MDESLKKIISDIELEYQNFGDRDAAERLRRRVTKHYRGRIFISHTAADSAWCKQRILPDIGRTYGFDSYFFLSKANHAFTVRTHRVLVESAFLGAKTVICIVSQRSVLSDWTKLEALWTVEQRHPVIACLLDDAHPKQLHPHLMGIQRWSRLSEQIFRVDKWSLCRG